jgi:hypothetical protein
MTNDDAIKGLQQAVVEINAVVTGLQAQQPPAPVPTPVPVPVPQPLLAPTGFRAVAGDGRVTLSWNAVPGATGYRPQLGLATGNYFGSYDLPASALSGSFDNPPLTNGTKYFFVVCALSGTAAGPNSAEVTATPAAAVPVPVPTPTPVPVPTPTPVPAPTPPSGMRVGVNVSWEIDWEDPANVFVPGVNFATTTNPFQPQLVLELRKYTGALRFMDFTATNTEQVTNWASRTQKTDPLSKQSGESGGVAWEWAALLCNLTGRDCWVNIPYQSAVGRNANDYALQLAKLLQAQLDPSLRVYVEYSNEAWNGMFPTLNYCLAQGKQLHLDTDNYTNAYEYYAVASAKCFEAFDAVFGKDSSRVVKVIGGMRDTAYLVDAELNQLAAEGHSLKNVVYAVAPYFSASTLAGLQADLTGMLKDLQVVVTAVKKHGVPIVTYEGGQELYSGALKPNRDPVMYTLYTSLLDSLKSMGFAEACLYLHQSPYDDGNAWGLEEKLGQDLATAHKMRAVLDWIKKNP